MKFINEKKLAEIHDFITDIINETRDGRLYVIGDSRSSTTYATETHNYYRQMFAQLGIEVMFSAENGLTSYQWRTNTSVTTTARIDHLKANLFGDGGENMLIEYRLFKNDHSVLGFMGVEEDIEKTILEIKKAAPKAMLMLNISCVSGTVQTGFDAQGIARSLAAKHDLYMVDQFEAMIEAYPRNGAVNCMMYDLTHENNNGMARQVNYLIDEICPPALKWMVKTIELPGATTEPTPVNLATPEVGMYNDLGADLGGDFRRLDAVTVFPRQLYWLKHQGSRRDIYFKYGSTNTYVKVNLPNLMPGQTRWLIRTPDYISASGGLLKINIETANVAAYDALSDVPELVNAFHQTPYIMPQANINVGLELEIKQS